MTLRECRELIDAQIGWLTKSNYIHPLCDDSSMFTEALLAEAQLNEEHIVAAIEQFIATGSWPQWHAETHHEQLYHLHHRLLLAQRSLARIANDPKLTKTIGVGLPLLDRRAALRLLLVTGWNEGGADYLQDWAADYIRKNPPPAHSQ